MGPQPEPPTRDRSRERSGDQPPPETVAPLPPRLEAIRARLEAAWQGAAPGPTLPRIEDHLAGLAEGERLALLRELVPQAMAHRRQRGEQPRAEGSAKVARTVSVGFPLLPWRLARAPPVVRMAGRAAGVDPLV
jgi:hypothetical protein